MQEGASKPAPPASPDRPTWWQRHARKLWLTVRLVALAVAVVAIVWWLVLAPVPVETHTVEGGTVTAEVFGTGTLEARDRAAIGPKVAGLITSVTVDQGDHVKSGDTLIYLEDTDFRQQVGVAEAEMAAWAAGVDRLQADQARAKAVLNNARLTHERLLVAAQSNATSAQEVDKAAETLAIAEAELTRAAAAVAEGQRRVAASERTLEYQRARLHDTTIEAPFDALVVRRDRDAGDVVTAGSSVLELVSLDEMWITAWVDESELARLAPDQPARVTFRSDPSTEFTGTVVRIGREADRETREIIVDVRVDSLPENWAVGQRAEVYIRVKQTQAQAVLPARLLLVREGNPGVMLDLDGKARWNPIQIGLRGRETIEVTSGLEPGDLVISPDNTAPLRDGRRIRSK